MNSLMLFRFFMLLGHKLTVVRSMICCFYGAVLLSQNKHVLPSGSYFFFRPTHGLYSIPESWSSNVGITPYPYHGNNSFDTSSTNIDLSQHMERTYPYRPSVTRPLQPLQPILEVGMTSSNFKMLNG